METHDSYPTTRAKDTNEKPGEAVPTKPAKQPACQGTGGLLLRIKAEDFL
jgi:hypothetical protein